MAVTKLTLRVPDPLRDRLKAAAERECISLNALIVRVLSGLQGAPNPKAPYSRRGPGSRVMIDQIPPSELNGLLGTVIERRVSIGAYLVRLDNPVYPDMLFKDHEFADAPQAAPKEPK